MFYIGVFFVMFGLCSALKPQKLCVNCQYFFIGKNTDVKFGTCFLCPKEEDNLKNFLVTGTTVYDEYSFCSTARSNVNMCGKDGQKYRKKYDFKKKGSLNEEKRLDF